MNWAEVLDQLAQTLAQTAAEAAAAEQALATPDAEETPRSEPIVQRLRQLDTCASQATQSAAQAATSLEQSEAGLHRWLAETEALRTRLANQATPSVS